MSPLDQLPDRAAIVCRYVPCVTFSCGSSILMEETGLAIAALHPAVGPRGNTRRRINPDDGVGRCQARLRPTGQRSEGRSALGVPAVASDALCMYIRHDVHVDQSADSVRRELLEPPERWLPPSVAEPIGVRQYRARVGFSAPGTRISKQVELTLGQPEAVGPWLVIPVAWRATGPSQLFPVLDAKLTVEPLGTHSSKLWLGGTYEPPLGALGREIDGAVMHNVAEATIKEFVENVAARLSELAANRPA